MNLRFRHRVKRLAIQTGGLRLLRKLRDALLPRPALDLERILATGEAPLPTSATIEPTLACNLHFTMCFQNDYRDRGIAKELGTDGLMRLVERLPPTIRFAYFVGGEVFMRKGFHELLHAVDDAGIDTFITTNGTRIGPKDWDVLDEARHLTGVGFSLDGLGPVHDAVRGEGTYDTIVGNIQKATQRYRTYVSFVMMEENYRQIPEFARTVASWGVHEIGFVHEMYCLAQDMAATRRRLGWTGINDVMMTVKERDWTKDAFQELLGILERMPSQEKKYHFVSALEPPLPPETFPALYEGTIRTRHRLYCRELTNLYLDPAGNVVQCSFLRHAFGNVIDQPVQQIWNSDGMREFRKTLLAGNLLPVCRRCCKLAVWPEESGGLGPVDQLETVAEPLIMPSPLRPVASPGPALTAPEVRGPA
ncbi:MAG TPA: radical SAM protein [Nitrospirales bacterium]|nr:radical SAM protein [Nitrospirales bacterium]